MTLIPVSLPALMPALIAALIGLRIYKRIRRLIGRQPVRVGRLAFTAIAFPILIVLVGLSGLRDIVLLQGLAAGVGLGLVLGWFGLRLTRFEVTPEGHFYVPNTIIGIGVSMLFIGRLVYRFGVLYLSAGRLDPGTIQSFGSSPLTLATFGIVAGYYTAFAIGILAWYRKSRYTGIAPSATVEPPTL